MQIEVRPVQGTEFSALVEKAREIASACQAIIERQHAADEFNEDGKVVMCTEAASLLTQVVLEAARLELDAPRMALLPGVAVACGMITTADPSRTEKGRATSGKMAQTFMDFYMRGMTMGAEVSASR